ncbi:MAG: PUR family DNA/RNA-binding protein [Paludibacteraceae bacterium]|nr:PUR family DNA/RNA-binding protein [Paludibacteraceae bacterium]
MISFFNRNQKEEPQRAPREDREDKEIVFSKAVKAGKRVYYLDVKKDRRSDLFLSITESKRKSVTEDGQFIFEKHKIFLYKEDFDKFEEAMKEVLDYMRQAMPAVEPAEADAPAESETTEPEAQAPTEEA